MGMRAGQNRRQVDNHVLYYNRPCGKVRTMGAKKPSKVRVTVCPFICPSCGVCFFLHRLPFHMPERPSASKYFRPCPKSRAQATKATPKKAPTASHGQHEGAREKPDGASLRTPHASEAGARARAAIRCSPRSRRTRSRLAPPRQRPSRRPKCQSRPVRSQLHLLLAPPARLQLHQHRRRLAPSKDDSMTARWARDFVSNCTFPLSAAENHDPPLPISKVRV
jgi:hypothetical protein